MPQFFRIYDNRLYPTSEVEHLGWDLRKDPSRIPQEYLDQKEFLVMRTCFGVGDWGIINGMPCLLNRFYPGCKVYVPSPKMLRNIFGNYGDQWNSWKNPYQVVHTIFDNNPYVEGFVDSWPGEIYHDHFRVFDGEIEEPLITQMARFWAMETDMGITPYQSPKLYFSQEETKLTNFIIDNHTYDGKYGTLLLSDRYKSEGLNLIQKELDKNDDIEFMYWSSDPDCFGLKFNKGLNLRHINIRIQMCLKVHALLNIGNQTGVNDTISAMSPTLTVPRGKLGSNIIPEQHYLI